LPPTYPQPVFHNENASPLPGLIWDNRTNFYRTILVTQTTSSPAWLRTIFNRRMLICIFTGFSSGLPLYLLFNLVPAWLKNGNVPLTVIGVFALAQFPFTWKFLWAPLLDRYNIVSWLGRRRSWMFVTQFGLIAAIAWLGQTSISGSGFPWHAFMLASVIALLSATQDIALDAFRREILPDEELGLGNAIHVNAYRIAGLVPGSLSLILADKMPWGWVFAITAAFMFPGLVMTLLVREPAVAKGTPRTLRAAVVEPFREFFGRHGIKSALLVLAFLFLYKLGDSLCTALATPFYLDIGFSMTEIGIVAKNAGLWASVGGGILGGLWMIKLGINRALWLFGVVQIVSILGFAGLAWVGPPFVAPKDHGAMSPDAFVQAVTGDVFANVCANRATLTENTKNAHTLVDNSLRRYFNFDRMTGLATGPDWKEASREQRKSLTDAFHALLLRDWAGSVFQHCDWTVETKPSLDAPDAREVTVSAAIHQVGTQAIAVDFSLEKTEQGWKVFNIAVDGQSLAENYRETFADKLHTVGMDGLIEWVRGQIKTDFVALLALALVIGFEALGVGLGSAAFVAFMARTTHPAYTATQLALFTSLMAVPRTLVNASAGWLIEGMGGWFNFFWLCFFLGIPGMLLLFKVAPWNGSPPLPVAANEENAGSK
jgi:PAT family beta-lactamase induction signal transducer AmpG